MQARGFRTTDRRCTIHKPFHRHALRGLMLSAGLAALLVFPGSGASAAGAPTRTPFVYPPYQYFPAGTVCSFPQSVITDKNNEVITTFPPDANSDVVQIISGVLVQTYTNLDNNKSIIANVSGPAKFVIHPDGSGTVTIQGPATLPIAAGDTWVDGTPGPTVILFSGHLEGTLSPSGAIHPVRFSGTYSNLCAALS